MCPLSKKPSWSTWTGACHSIFSLRLQVSLLSSPLAAPSQEKSGSVAQCQLKGWDSLCSADWAGHHSMVGICKELWVGEHLTFPCISFPILFPFSLLLAAPTSSPFHLLHTHQPTKPPTCPNFSYIIYLFHTYPTFLPNGKPKQFTSLSFSLIPPISFSLLKEQFLFHSSMKRNQCTHL